MHRRGPQSLTKDWSPLPPMGPVPLLRMRNGQDIKSAAAGQTGSGRKDAVAMTEEEANLRLHSLFVQAKYSSMSSANLARVKMLLANDAG